MGQKKLTLGNAIAFIAIGLLFLFSIIGVWCRESDIEMAILISLGITISNVVLLYALVSLKKKDNNNRIWFFVEMVLALMLFGVCCLDATYGGTKNIVSYWYNSEKLSEAYYKDIQAVDSLTIKRYHTDLDTQMGIAVEGILAYNGDSKKAASNKDYIIKYYEGISKGKTTMPKKDIEGHFSALKKVYMIDSLQNQDIPDFDFWKLGELSESPEKYKSKVIEKIKSKLNTYNKRNDTAYNQIPVIDKINKKSKTSFSYAGECQFEWLDPVPTTPENLKTAKDDYGNSVLGWVVFILLYLGVFLKYLTARRTISISMIFDTRINKRGNDIGVRL